MTEQHRKPQISHAEAALMSGRPYERAHVGHDKRDNRIDQELAAEDKEILERKDDARRQREQHKHSEQQHR
ncbi:uncharacterized protein RHIMIDRAFT_289041 [Rhizopus microsporus ATCC 52813]|uniref:Uncharacterized protein n=1 Tax=Rhizopus microsporus ATCC 52813 TaxID=1340429 RepID=A0A2G4T594_RHIZD|nr:uncharacterized protein RHIMIDRAFT_289041 [Rhizopus microsporus ATCC 52813]PHZ16181.1 hypothetical protein RHIMIDRAFT_289041 [Rhizopus microsporus ATCC 52813]